MTHTFKTLSFCLSLICMCLLLIKNIDLIHGPVAPLACFSLLFRVAGGSMVSSALIADSTAFTRINDCCSCVLGCCVSLTCVLNKIQKIVRYLLLLDHKQRVSVYFCCSQYKVAITVCSSACF